MGAMTWTALFVLSLAWLPTSSWDDAMYRAELAQAIVAAEPTPHEARILLRIARWESHYRRDVGSCAIVGPSGHDLGPFQHVTTDARLRSRICGSLVEAARVARDDVRRSFGMCASNPPETRLAVYARGSCSSVEGQRLSRTRYVE